MREIAHEYGKVDYDLSLGTGHPGRNLSFVPQGMTAEGLKSIQRRGYGEFFLRPRQILVLLKSIESFEDLKKYFRLAMTFAKFYFKS